MATTSNTYTGNGSNKLFSITFPYIETTDIDVYLNGTLQTVTTQYTFANATTIEFVAAPANGAVVLLDRSTDDSTLAATFFPGSSIKAADLNADFDQTLYVVQEINNKAVKINDPLYANKTYIDAADALKVNKAGDTMSGNLAMGGNKVTGLGSPTASTDAATRGYVDGVALAGTVPDGDRGDITVSGVGTVWSIDSGAVTSSKIADGTIVNADVNASAGIVATKLAFTQSGTGATARTVDSKLKEVVSVKDFGAVGNGVADDTAAINAAILAAHNIKTNVLVDDATYSVVVNFDNGKDYKVVGTILLPNGIVLDGNGSRLIGSYGSAVSTVYNDSLPSIIETGYFNGTTIATNRAASNTTQRITNSGICNFTFINANCGINAINLQETSFIRNCRFNNVSAAMRLKSCYYLVVDQIMIRSSSQATNQYAVLLHGGDCSDMRIQQVSCVGCSVGISVNSTPAGSTSLSGCSFEDAYLANGAGTVNGIGVYFDAGYFQGWTIANCYFEGVQTGIKFNTGAAAYGMSIRNNFYSSCQSALIGSENSMRVSEFIGNGVADDGGIIRNLVDLSASGNDVFVQVPAISTNSTLGLGAFITNHTLGNTGTAQTSSVWKNTSSPFAAIAKAEPGLVNQSKLNSLPFEGANIISLPNQVPFVNRTVSVNTLTIDTNITYDDSNVLVFNFYGGTDTVNYDLKGFIFGTTVSWVTRTPVTVTATVTNNSGAVRLVFGSLTASVPIINTTGMIRHV